MTIVPEAINIKIDNIPQVVIMIFVTWIIIALCSIFARIRSNIVPRGISSIFEILFDFILSFADKAIGEKSCRFYPLFIGIFLFVLTGNLIGLLPGFSSPTANINVTLGLAFITFLFYHYQGFREHGYNYIRQFLGPNLPFYLFPINILMFIIEIISHCARVVSLSLRLFCNIFAKEVLLGLLASLLITFLANPGFIEKTLSLSVFFLRPLIIILGVLVSFVQAFIFVALSIVYVAGAVSETH